jgi:hypothetical protein
MSKADGAAPALAGLSAAAANEPVDEPAGAVFDPAGAVFADEPDEGAAGPKPPTAPPALNAGS